MIRSLLALLLLVTLTACSGPPPRRGDTPTDGGTADTCRDGLLTDGEETIDCGGDCPPCETSECEDGEDCEPDECEGDECVEEQACSREDGTLAFECACDSADECSSDRCTEGRCDAAQLTISSSADTYSLRSYIGERFAFDCPADVRLRSVWGTDIYTLDSDVCTAGIHAGRFKHENGGRVVIEIKAGQDRYEASTRHGVTSRSWSRYHTSFQVVMVLSCSDGEKSHDEGDVDCGRNCALCEIGRTCERNADCDSGFCEDGVCAPPLCSNERLDEGEADVDCGGDCPKCQNGSTCSDGADCATGFCEDGECAPPLCSNERLDEGESDVDCGGPNCLTCTVGKRCNGNSDCRGSDECRDGVCAVPYCRDGVQGQDETDVDCGGPVCSTCTVGKRCGGSADCRGSSECRDGVCAVPYCQDGVQGQDETDVDCGGPACSKCRAGQACVEDGDCKGGRCDDGVCAVPTCFNGIKDGLETDVDCGGVVCGPCGLEKACAISMDCESRTCTQRECAPAGACVNGIRDGNESDVDCGGDCAPCAGGLSCNGHDDCEGSESCQSGLCAIPVADAFTRVGFSNVAPGRRWTYQCPPDLNQGSVWGVDVFTSDSSICTAAVHAGLHTFATGGVVTVESRRGLVAYAGSTENGVTTRAYGAYGSAYAFVPPGPCANGVRDGSETDVDCGGDRCARCGAGAACGGDSDCAGDLCVEGHCAD